MATRKSLSHRVPVYQVAETIYTQEQLAAHCSTNSVTLLTFLIVLFNAYFYVCSRALVIYFGVVRETTNEDIM